MIPLGLPWMASWLFPKLGYDIDAHGAYWIYGAALILGGIVVFYFGRAVNGISGGLLASYARGRPAARHTINRFPMEHVGPVAIAIGVVVLVYWMFRHTS